MGNNKVGRNDPCPCGSGKKYKKCCLLKIDSDKNLPGFILADAPSMRMNNLLLKMDRHEFTQAYKGPSMDIQRSMMRAFSSSPSKSDSEKALVVWKDRVEEQIKLLCSKHSKYYWLFLLRRIFPETPEPYDLPTTPYLHRITFNLAVLKYGNNDQTEEFVAVPGSADMKQYVFTEEPYSGETVDMNRANAIEIEDEAEFGEARHPSIIPRQITREDAINIYQIEYLALDYYLITAQLRRLWKGGQIRVHQGSFSRVELPREVEGLVKLYDKRVPIYGNLLSSFGSITSLSTIKQEVGKDYFLMFVPVPNTEKSEVPLVFRGEEFFGGKVRGPVYVKGNPANFVLTPISIKPFYEKMCMFRKSIGDIFGFSPEEFVSFLIALDNQRSWLYNLYSRYHFLQRGYTIKPGMKDFKRYLAEPYIETHRRLFNDRPEPGHLSFERMTGLMTYNTEDFEHISLWDRTGAKLLLRVPGGTLVDHSVVPALLESIFSELSTRVAIDGQIGQVRGDDFENEVEKFLRLNIADFQPWVCHRKLEFLSGLERDVDVSFLFGQVLFVVECKSFSVPLAFDRGEISALEIREVKLNNALKQADTLCELLSKEHKGKNFELPQATTHIISIVASPFPEYIPKRNDQYFLTRDIPRVCTPEEIAEFVRHFRLSNYLSKPFVWEIS